MASLLVESVDRATLGEREQKRVMNVRCCVAYMKVTPTISNWIQPITIKTTSRCGLDGSQPDHDPVASVDRPLGAS